MLADVAREVVPLANGHGGEPRCDGDASHHLEAKGHEKVARSGGGRAVVVKATAEPVVNRDGAPGEAVAPLPADDRTRSDL